MAVPVLERACSFEIEASSRESARPLSVAAKNVLLVPTNENDLHGLSRGYVTPSVYLSSESSREKKADGYTCSNASTTDRRLPIDTRARAVSQQARHAQ